MRVDLKLLPGRAKSLGDPEEVSRVFKMLRLVESWRGFESSFGLLFVDLALNGSTTKRQSKGMRLSSLCGPSNA